MEKDRILIVCTTDSMIWNFLMPHIDELKKRGHDVECACSETGFYYSELQKKGYELNKIGFTRSPLSKDNVKAYKELKKLIKEKDFNIVYCHEPVGGMMGRLAGWICKKTVIYMSHGFHFFSGAPLKHWLFYYTAEWFMSFMTDAIITINKEDYSRACKMHADRNYYVHGIGIQPGKNNTSKDRDTVRKELELSSYDKVLISIGELSTRKNHKIVLRAMNQTPDDTIKLIICGEGELEDELKTIASELGLQDRVKFTGFVRNVADYIAASDAMVLPSLWEGLGLVGLEALQMGVPVLGAKRQGIKDYVIEGETGYLFDPSRADDLADKLTRLFEEECLQEQRQKMIDMASAYNMESVLRDFDPIYEKEFR